MMIRETLYREIIQCLPIACVDVVIRGSDDRFLLVKRRNEPLKGEWWVVGGRILHGERADHGARRKVLEEIGIQIEGLRVLGYYEDFFDRNSFGVPGIYHTLSVVFETILPAGTTIVLDKQSSDWKWADRLPDRFAVLQEPTDAQISD